MRNRWLAATTLVLFTVAILAASAAFAFAAPVNDAFSAAILLSGGSGTTTGTNVAATLELNEVHPADNDGSIWYRWVAPTDDIVSFDTTGSIDGVGDPTAVDVNVYTGTAVTSIVEVPESYVPHAGRVEVPVKAGTTYRISLTCPGLAERGETHLAWQTQGNTGHITGTVTATNGGTAISGIQVDAYAVGGAGNSLRTVLTNASGGYDLTGLGTGNYQVRFTDPAPTTYITEWYDNQLTQGSSTTIAVVNGVTTSGKNAVLDRTVSISGNVKSNGVNTANVTVQLLPYTGGVLDSGASATALTNTSGNYTFTGLSTKVGDGNYYVVQFVEPFGSGFTTQFYNQKSNILLATHLQPLEGAALTGINCIWPTASPGTLSGTVTSGGSPVQDVTVTVSSSAGSATTAANGTYSIGNIAPGTYSVTYSKTGYNNYTYTGVAITAGATTTRSPILIRTPGTLSGTVTSGGNPVSGASVSVPGTATVQTAANGTYTVAGITPGTYTVKYFKTGYNSQWVSGVSITTGNTTTQDVSLIQTPGTVTGTVTSGGSPVANVSVSVAGTATVVQTADNGTYTVAGITPGTRNVMYSKAGYNSQWINVSITSGATTTQNVSLIQTPGTLSGTVTSGGNPVANVSVSVAGTGTVQTAANGTYTVAGITPGTRNVTYIKTGYNSQWINGVVINTGATTTQNVSLLQTPGTLSGTVTSGGSPLAGVTVSVPGTATVTTAANGTYSVAGITPGSYNVTYSLSNYTSQTINNIAIATNAVTTQNVALVQVPGTLSGTVTDQNGGGNLSGVVVTVSGSGVGPATTAGNGTYSLGSIPPGTYSVTYSKEGYSAQTVDNLVISPGLTTTQDIALVAVPVGTKPGKLIGTVTVSGSGAPLSGVTVSVAGTGTVPTDVNGSYEVGGITPGTYSVTYVKNGYAGLPHDVIISDDATTTQDAVLDALPGTLSGTVTIAGGVLPLSGVLVTVAGFGPTTTTASNGTYTLGNIPAGAHSVTYSKTGYASQTKSFTLDPGGSFPWSPALVAANKTNVYRFRNLQNGFYLWSADESEKAFIIGNLSATWLYEGVAYTRNTVTNTAPLWRFRNIAGGYYLYSADPGEKDTIVATLPNVWQLEGQAYKVSRDPSGRKVWRFRNLQDGTYLLSADPAEKDSIVANLSYLWQLEGPAFYLAP